MGRRFVLTYAHVIDGRHVSSDIRSRGTVFRVPVHRRRTEPAIDVYVYVHVYSTADHKTDAGRDEKNHETGVNGEFRGRFGSPKDAGTMSFSIRNDQRALFPNVLSCHDTVTNLPSESSAL